MRHVPKKDAKAILRKIELLAQDPRPRWAEKMKSRPGYRIACGNYRILYTVDDHKLIVFVVDIGNRKDVYK